MTDLRSVRPAKLTKNLQRDAISKLTDSPQGANKNMIEVYRKSNWYNYLKNTIYNRHLICSSAFMYTIKFVCVIFFTK